MRGQSVPSATQTTSRAEADSAQQQDAVAELTSPTCGEKELRRSHGGLH